jgi:chemotaxis methyl-accepting protein methylase
MATKESIRDLVCELTSKVEKLEATLNAISINESKPKQTNDEVKKPRIITDKGYLSKAKMLFYHENKLTKRVQDKMKDYNFIAESDKKHNRVKWRLLKKFTDSMFDDLSEDMQEKYMNNAKGCNLETIAEEVGEECPLDV